MKKIWIAVLICFGIIALGAGGFYVWKTRQIKSEVTLPAVSPTPTPQDLETWDDPAGFSFKYPKGIVIDKHDEDTQNYAHLEMTHAGYPGTIIIWAKDTTAASLDAWIKSDKILKNATVMDTTFGGIAGKKFVVKEPNPMLITGTITDQIVFTVEAQPKDGEYWQNAYNTLIESFAFTDGTGGGGEAGEEVAVDEEETLE